MTRDLGEFGAALRELDDEEKETFRFFGEQFTVVADVPVIIEMKLAAGLNGSAPEDDALAAMWDALRIALGDEEFARFETLALQKRADLRWS